MASKIIVSDYSPAWAAEFNKLKMIYDAVLDGLDIQHVGSTSVPGLAAKPIIDIDIIIDDASQLPGVIKKLEALGYYHIGDLGIPMREAFKHHDNSIGGMPLHRHNLYVCIKDCDSLKNHLILRDYLRQQPEKAAEYSLLKKKLADEYPDSLALYTEKKTAFITAILKQEGFTANSLDQIAEQNKTLRF
jgi:GrpB-like predicted nucleotidyltransferase (UPF0157 family)